MHSVFLFYSGFYKVLGSYSPNVLIGQLQPLMKELAEMEKVNSQLSAAVEDVTREHREKAEVFLSFVTL